MNEYRRDDKVNAELYLLAAIGGIVVAVICFRDVEGAFDGVRVTRQSVFPVDMIESISLSNDWLKVRTTADETFGMPVSVIGADMLLAAFNPNKNTMPDGRLLVDAWFLRNESASALRMTVRFNCFVSPSRDWRPITMKICLALLDQHDYNNDKKQWALRFTEFARIYDCVL